MPISTKLLREFCDLPTAAFREDAVYARLDRWLAKRPELGIEIDRFGNRLVTLPGRDTKLPRLVLVAHTDHPAFVAGESNDGTLRAEFRGGVTAELCRKSKVRFFADAVEIVLKIGEVEANDDGRLTGATFKLKKNHNVLPGTVGMFDEGRATEEGDEFKARACDDLAGVAAALTTLDVLRKEPPLTTTCVLLTRAEEVGFVGAIAAVKDRKLLSKSDRIISIETSAEQPVAVRGKGVVLRVGDRTSVFHSGFSYFLASRAESLVKSKKGFAFQRALMPGGTCEGTVFDAFGHVATAVCVALGNYHNMDKKRGRTGPEVISVADWRNMVELFVDAARHLEEFTGKHDALRERLLARFDKHKHLFADPAALSP